MGEDDDEESEEDMSDEEAQDLKHLAEMKKVVQAGKAKEVKPAADVQGFKKGGDLDKSLKAANKNTVKNSMQVESGSDDDEEEEDDMDESGEDVGMFDLEAEEGEDEDDEELDSDLAGSDSEEEDPKDIIQKQFDLMKRMVQV